MDDIGITVSYSTYSYKLTDIPEPRIRTAKEWRRYQVAMKRFRQRIDDHFMRAFDGYDWSRRAHRPSPR